MSEQHTIIRVVRDASIPIGDAAVTRRYVAAMPEDAVDDNRVQTAAAFQRGCFNFLMSLDPRERDADELLTELDVEQRESLIMLAMSHLTRLAADAKEGPIPAAALPSGPTLRTFRSAFRRGLVALLLLSSASGITMTLVQVAHLKTTADAFSAVILGLWLTLLPLLLIDDIRVLFTKRGHQ